MRANSLVTFHLKGELGKLYGSEFRFAATSIAHGIRSMCYQLKGDDKTDPFVEVLSKGYYSVIRNGREIDIDELNVGLGKTRDVYIVPVPEGEGGGGGVGKFIFGALLVTGALLLAGPGGAGLAGGFTLGGTSSIGISLGQIAAVGGLIGAAGAAQLLSPTPGAADTRVREAPEERPSFLIDSLTNTTEEGAPVPIVHGKKIMIGSHVISAGLDVEQVPLENVIPPIGQFQTNHFVGQGIQIDADGEFRGLAFPLSPLTGGSFMPSNQSNGGPTAWPDVAFGSINAPLFRNTSILQIMELHLTDPPVRGSQDALRVTMVGGPTPPVNYFTSIKIQQPFGTVVMVKLTAEVTKYVAGGLAAGISGSTWEWALGPSFIFDGTTTLQVTFGYDT